MIPQRPFRGRDHLEEAQIQPLYGALNGRLDSGNLVTDPRSGVMLVSTNPGVIVNTTGTASSDTVTQRGITNACQINGFFFTASSGVTASATGTIAFTHGLGRVPAGLLSFVQTFTNTNIEVYAARKTDWNSRSFFLGFNLGTATTVTVSALLV